MCGWESRSYRGEKEGRKNEAGKQTHSHSGQLWLMDRDTHTEREKKRETALSIFSEEKSDIWP